MKSHGYGMEYASARATPELVGRKEILGIIQKAVENKAKKTQVVYITARGGMGKTRLLEEVVKFWNKRSQSQKKPNILVASRLVDLYHTYTHNPEGLIDEIVEVLGKKHFKGYLEKRAQLIHTKYEMGETPSEASKQAKIDAFVKELNELGRTYDKVVLVFDTAEVLRFQKDPSQTALGLTNNLTTVARWLIQELLSQLRNVTVLIAGRPPEKKEMQDELLARLSEIGVKVTSYPLPGFQLDETLEYFDVMAKAIRKEDPQKAGRIQSIPKDIRQVIHFLTQGEPFVLALLIDYVAITDELPSLEQRELIEFRKELRDRIIEAIQKSLRPSDEVVEALSWAPKGMGAQLLAWTLNHHKPSKEEVEEARKAIDELRQPKKRLSFVKIRFADDLVFFQDEMYSLMEEIHRSEGMQIQKERMNKNILDFYEWKISEVRGEIQEQEMELDSTRHVPGRLPIQISTGIVHEEERLSTRRDRLQSYQVEHVYYTLRVNPVDGFKLYLEYADEAFQNREENLWLLLQDELLRYAYGYLPVEGLTWNDIESYMGTRWIRTSLARDEIDEAKRKINIFRKTFTRNLLKTGSYLDLELNIWEIWAQVYRGGDSKDIRASLNEILKHVENLPSKTSLDQWRRKFLRAYALYWHGYLSWSQGKFKDAVQWYLQALPLWRALNMEVQAATTLNDLSWAEAETGSFETALPHCKDGLKLRRKLGKPYLVALSLNTLGLIEIRYGKPETAQFHCEQALEIFRRMEDARGIGLACLALAESLRRITNTDLFVYDEKQKISYLTRAAKYAEEAVLTFTKKVKEEPLRLVESYIELGCVYREWVRQLKTKSERTEKIQHSQAAYENAVKVAREAGYEYRALDALVNMAWLYFYAGNFQEARTILARKVRDHIGDEYFYTTKHAAMSNAPTPWHWVQVGKANVLLGMMYFEEYKSLLKKDPELSQERLHQAAHNWALSMAYNRLYGNFFRDFNKGREDIYNKLAELNIQEMGWVKDSMKKTYGEYHIPEDGRAFEELLKERFQI